MTKIVEIVKVTGLFPMYKDTVEADFIQLVGFEFENGDECGFKIVAQKGLYNVGDTAIYVQPDYCLSNDVSLFDSFTNPDGNPNKSRLGKQNRIKSIKFNFNETQTGSDPVYSNGILMPIKPVLRYLKVDSLEGLELAEKLEIIKYETPEKGSAGKGINEFPEFFYKTDEENIMNIINKVKHVIENGNGETEFGLVIKNDGSSFSQFTRKNEEGEFYNTVCSRSQTKITDATETVAYENETGKFTKYFNQEESVLGWRNEKTNEFVFDDVAKETLTPITVPVNDTWIDLSRKSGLFDGALEYCKKHNVTLGFRGEIFGQALKGSGNKINPDAKLEQQLKLFGVDLLENGNAIRQHYGNEHNLIKVANEIGVPCSTVVVCKPKNIDELFEAGKKIFKDEENEGRIIEGVVIRTMNSNEISCKFMNDYYDSMK